MAKVLMVTAEATPFAKTGGLGEVLEALPKALVRAGEQVAVLLPLYRRIELSNARLMYEGLQFGLGPHHYAANILAQDEEGVHYLFLQIPELYDREEVYDEYDDNALRFGALCHAALGALRHVFAPEVIHCHDWQAALIPLLLKEIYKVHPAYIGLKSVLTIHNLGYPGVFPSSVLSELGLPDRLFRPDLLEFHGQVNILKGGLISSDLLTTVSPRYAREIQTPEFGFGLDGVLRARSDTLIGILNGADYVAWNPARDPLIQQNFTRDDLAGKEACKRALLAECGLPKARISRPLIGIASRFAEQKGFDLLMQIPHEIAAEDVTIVAMGQGEPRFEDFFRWFASAYRDRVALTVGYDDDKAHRIQAGCDMFLMPSRYEPCGLTQIYSMRYGTLPIVHATGGLDDTVDEETGFTFAEYHSVALLDCLREALKRYGSPRWIEMIRAAMQQDFSWDVSARKYVRLYRQLVGGTLRYPG